MRLKEFLLKVKKKILPGRFSSKNFIELLKYKGVNIGQGTYFFDPITTIIDTQRPSLIKIGKYCKITAGVKILAHDYSRSVLRMKYKQIIADARLTEIGDNVFIGIDSIILEGAKIGNNVIIGAGSVISGTIPDNVVVAGNPAKVIKTLDEFYDKRKEKYIEEAKFYAKNLAENGIKPSVLNMGAFFPIYFPRDLDLLKKYGINTNLNGDDEEDIIKSFLETEPVYSSFEEFLRECEI